MNEDFKGLLQHVVSTLNLPLSELKQKYAAFPICLLEYSEDNPHKQIVEIRFNSAKATISCLINNQQDCSNSFLFFDTECNEDTFITYLLESFDYHFKDSCWILSDGNLKVGKVDNFHTFYFSKPN